VTIATKVSNFEVLLSGLTEDSAILRCGAASLGNRIPTFRNNLVSSSLGVETS